MTAWPATRLSARVFIFSVVDSFVDPAVPFVVSMALWTLGSGECGGSGAACSDQHQSAAD